MKILKKLISNFAENRKAQINETQVHSNTKKAIRQSPLSLSSRSTPFLSLIKKEQACKRKQSIKQSILR